MKTETTKKKTLSGTVVSDKMQKTVVVKVDRFVKHAKYQKYMVISKKYKAHAEKPHAVGEKVEITEIKPMSKDKHFKVVEA